MLTGERFQTAGHSGCRVEGGQQQCQTAVLVGELDAQCVPA
jgi:hypothetical protein